MKLKELGVPQKSNWMWLLDVKKTVPELFDKCRCFVESIEKLPQYSDRKVPPIFELVWKKHEGDTIDGYSTYNVAELGEFLPATLSDSENMRLNIWKHEEKEWYVSYETTGYCMDGMQNIKDESLVDAMAKALIWLIQNGHLDPKTLN